MIVTNESIRHLPAAGELEGGVLLTSVQSLRLRGRLAEDTRTRWQQA